ncbi:hypothetical protein VNO77_35043 [Canavalia gladiata]|uniref:Pentatricopeptide repeat-containing protein n=1 Tax=Canavalia gladiata TaxID=3824 RepID=A0AAN9PYU1_CANGL
MGIRNLCYILRFFSIPRSSSSFHFFSYTPLPSSFLFPIGCSSLCSSDHPFAHSSTFHSDINNGCLSLALHLHTRKYFSSYTYKSYWFRPYATPEQVSHIIALIREDVDDLGSELNGMNVSLSDSSVVEIFQRLACERVSALRFFDWLKGSDPELCVDPDIGALFVNNCGLLGNYEAMVPILSEFNLKGVFLGMKAFGFLMDMGLDKASSMECVRRVMDVFNEVGGVYRSCGVQLLIEMFGDSGCFEMAEFVIRTAGRKMMHYNVLMRILCKKGDCARVGDWVKEIKRCDCDPNGSSYDFLLSCLCKNGKIDEACQMLETMEKDYGLADVRTFDILVNFLCKCHQFGLALKLLDKMSLKGIEPSILTHAAIIKCYFESGKHEEAHEYVIGSAGMLSYSSNANYSLLATLYLKNGNVLLAHKVLSEMMDKGLKPNFSVYMKIRKRLEKQDEKDLSLELLRRYSSLIEK